MSNATVFSKSPKWHTTFYYEQELRSYYMNQILSGLVKPGIYNSTLSLVLIPNTAVSGGSLESGMHLYIKKGSTFIFSNSYKSLKKDFKTENGGKYTRTVLERNFDYPGDVVIKCVAEEDMMLPIVTLIQGMSQGTTLQDVVFGDSEKYSEDSSQSNKQDFYIIAKFVYNPKENSTYTAPIFEVHTAKSDYISHVFEDDSDSGNTMVSDSYYFLPADNDVSDEMYPIPDGTTLYKGKGISLAANVSYLILGKVAELKNKGTMYSTSSVWRSTVDNYYSHIEYSKNHAFIARGLPEYSNNQLWDQSHQEPHIITAPDAKTVWLNLPYTQSDDVIVKADGDWKEVNSIGNYRTPEYINSLDASNPDKAFYKTVGTLKIADFTLSESIKSELANAWKNGVHNAERGIPDDFFKKASTDTGFVDAPYGFYSKYNLKNSPVVCDMVFLKLYKNISEGSSLEELLQSSATNLTSDDFIQYTWVSKAPENINFDPNFDIEGFRFRFRDLISSSEELNRYPIEHNRYCSTPGFLTNFFICPMDKCQANIDRLLPIITNNSFVPTVIDNMRQDGSLLSVEGTKKCTALVPILVGFRKLFKVDNGTTDGSWLSVDGISDTEKIHPANILSFFDLQNSTMNINSFKIKSDNVFNVLSVIA